MGIPEAIGFLPCDREDMQYVRARVPSISQVHGTCGRHTDLPAPVGSTQVRPSCSGLV